MSLSRSQVCVCCMMREISFSSLYFVHKRLCNVLEQLTNIDFVHISWNACMHSFIHSCYMSIYLFILLSIVTSSCKLEALDKFIQVIQPKNNNLPCIIIIIIIILWQVNSLIYLKHNHFTFYFRKLKDKIIV
jgi:hypothetical protein